MTNFTGHNYESQRLAGVTFACPCCARPIRVAQEFLGRDGLACPYCETEFQIRRTSRSHAGLPASVPGASTVPYPSNRVNWTTLSLLAGMSLLVLGGVGMAALGSAQRGESDPGPGTAVREVTPSVQENESVPVAETANITQDVDAPTAPAVASPEDESNKPSILSSADAQTLADQARKSLPELTEAPIGGANPADSDLAPVIEVSKSQTVQSGALPQLEASLPEPVPNVLREWKDQSGRVLVVGTFRELRNGIEVVVRAENGALELLALPALSREDQQFVRAQPVANPPQQIARSAPAQEAPVPTNVQPVSEPSQTPADSDKGVDRHWVAVPVGPSSRRNRRGDFIRDFRPQLVPVEVPPPGEYAFPMEVPIR